MTTDLDQMIRDNIERSKNLGRGINEHRIRVVRGPIHIGWIIPFAVETTIVSTLDGVDGVMQTPDPDKPPTG